MRIDVLTLFPEALAGFLDASIVGRARHAGIVDIGLTDIRDFARDRHRTVDDRPFGGGPGMVLCCDPVCDAVAQVRRDQPATVLVMLTPQGERFCQPVARELASHEAITLLCGHYEGFDDRIRQALLPREISVGDYVLSGGEAAALVVIDAVVRLLPGAVGCEQSIEDESFSHGLLEYPQYTRPREYAGLSVPPVLLSGDHEAVARWRRAQAIERTRARRPELLGEHGEPPDDGGSR